MYEPKSVNSLQKNHGY